MVDVAPPCALAALPFAPFAFHLDLLRDSPSAPLRWPWECAEATGVEAAAQAVGAPPPAPAPPQAALQQPCQRPAPAPAPRPAAPRGAAASSAGGVAAGASVVEACEASASTQRPGASCPESDAVAGSAGSNAGAEAPEAAPEPAAAAPRESSPGEAAAEAAAQAAARPPQRQKDRKKEASQGGGLTRGFLTKPAKGAKAAGPAKEAGASGKAAAATTFAACDTSHEAVSAAAAGLLAGTSAASGAGAKRKKTAPGHYWTTPPRRFEFSREREREVAVEGWRGLEQVGEIQKPFKAAPCLFYRLPSLVSAKQVSAILERCKQSDRFKVDPDSVDKTPTFEFYPFHDGAWADAGMRAVLEGVLEERVMPYVRERYGCRFCALSDILVRRYLPGERRTHAVHFDGHAYVTAVLGLSSPDDYEGGLYLQPEPDVASRTFFRVEPGDLFVHSFDLQHGVHVWKGARYSLIFWIKDSLQAVLERTTPWYDKLAGEGDADGLYNLAQNYEFGTFGKPLDIQKAIDLYERSAAVGHHFAMNNLGLVYKRAHEQAGLTGSLEKSCKWLKAAAETGFAMAQKNLGLAYANGNQGLKRDDAQALLWLRRAAEQLEVEAAFMVGEMYRMGRGVKSPDTREALLWFERSAEAGFPKAQYTLGMLYLEGGGGVRADVRRAEMWLGFAAKQGNSEAKNNLATLHAKRGDVSRAAEIWCALAEDGEPNAQCNIGMCYMRGMGRPQDLEQAARWLSSAAAQGHHMATEALLKLRSDDG